METVTSSSVGPVCDHLIDCFHIQSFKQRYLIIIDQSSRSKFNNSVTVATNSCHTRAHILLRWSFFSQNVKSEENGCQQPFWMLEIDHCQ